MIKRYKKIPITIEAVQFLGENVKEIVDFCGDNIDLYPLDLDTVDLNKVLYVKEAKIMTLEGVMTASVGDYIIKGVNGEFYPCKPDIFHKTYEEIV